MIGEAEHELVVEFDWFWVFPCAVVDVLVVEVVLLHQSQQRDINIQTISGKQTNHKAVPPDGLLSLCLVDNNVK